MGCSCTCQCGRKFDKFSGHLINLSDYCISELKKTSYFLTIKDRYNTDKQHHFVMCSDCIEKSLERKLTISDFKFKKGLWMTSNAAYFFRRLNLLTTKTVEWLETNDDKGLLPFEKGSWSIMLKIIKELNNVRKGL